MDQSLPSKNIYIHKGREGGLQYVIQGVGHMIVLHICCVAWWPLIQTYDRITGTGAARALKAPS